MNRRSRKRRLTRAHELHEHWRQLHIEARQIEECRNLPPEGTFVGTGVDGDIISMDVKGGFAGWLWRRIT